MNRSSLLGVVVRLRDEDQLGPMAKLVGMVLGSYAREGRAWPSQKTLAFKCTCGRRTVQRALLELEQAGLVEVEHRPGHSSVYRLAEVRHSGAPTCVTESHQVRHSGAPGAPEWRTHRESTKELSIETACARERAHEEFQIDPDNGRKLRDLTASLNGRIRAPT